MKSLKYAFASLVVISMVSTFIYSISLLISFPETLFYYINISNLVACAIILLFLITFTILRKSNFIKEEIFSKREYNILSTVTAITFVIFTICFISKSTIENWENGSEIYTNTMNYVFFPLYNGAIITIAQHLNI